MQNNSLARRVLGLVFSLSSATTALTRPRLERELGASPSELNFALHELTQLGLLDEKRLRLTLPGLAVAAACAAKGREKRRGRASSRQKLTVIEAPIALFSRREAPRAVA